MAGRVKQGNPQPTVSAAPLEGGENGRTESSAPCNKDCFNCPFDDCINDEMDSEDYAEAAKRDNLIKDTPERQRRLANQRSYYCSHREEILAYEREYRQKNRELIRAKSRHQYREKRKAQQKEYYQANKEKIAAKQKEHYAKNRERLSARARDYYAKNRDKINAQRRAEYAAKKQKQLEGGEK